MVGSKIIAWNYQFSTDLPALRGPPTLDIPYSGALATVDGGTFWVFLL